MKCENPKMSEEDTRQRITGMLLAEVKTGKLGWYYISVADEEFRGGFLIEARGPTEAWRLLHTLGYHTEGCSTSTHGPISEDIMKRIPVEQRWRRLSKDEALNLGK